MSKSKMATKANYKQRTGTWKIKIQYKITVALNIYYFNKPLTNGI